METGSPGATAAASGLDRETGFRQAARLLRCQASLSAVVAELKGNPEIMFPELPHRFLQLIL
jgi:hypothetical protein